ASTECRVRSTLTWKNVYRRKATPGEQLRGQVPVTQFGGMCQKLGIGIVAASSPQAEGRVNATTARTKSTDQETATTRHPQFRGGEAVFGAGISAPTQSRFGADRRSPRIITGRKPSARDLPPGNRAKHQQ